MRNIIKSNNGVVGIVVAVLLIGLMVSVVSLIQAVYVPKWMEQKEAEHMDEVVSQFSQLKFAIDTQVSTEQINTPIASSITLGSKELPYLMSSRAFGNILISSNDFTLSFTNLTDTYTYSFGTIKYSSFNAYFIDQTLIYEGGAIVVSQSDGNMISIKPSFSIISPGGILKIKINSQNIIGIGGKVVGSGYGTTAIQTEYHSSIESNITDITSITITTPYTNAWEVYLKWLFEQELDSSLYTITVTENDILIEFINSPEVLLKTSNIHAQIGAGWIE